MNKKIYLSSPTMNGEEQKYINEAFETNWVAPLGKNVEEFEKDTAKYVGVKKALALSSGTAALHLAVKLAGIQEGDIVLCSDLTFSATVNPVSYEKGIQVFVDSEEDTWNMDPEALRVAIKKYPNAKAVIIANLYGVPAKLDEIKQICDENNLVLIEDAAESLGALYNGKQTGTFGKYGIFSYNGNKIITTSGGGMLISNCENDIEKARFWSTQSREKARHYEHKEIGYNYRISNILAGIGRGQMKTLNQYIELKKSIYMQYKEGFKDINEIKMNPYLVNSNPNFWLSCITIEPKSNVTPISIIEALEKDNIESRPIWKPMHMQPVFKGYDYITVKEESVSEKIFMNGMCLPSDIKNTKEDMDRIISIVRKCFGK